MPSSPRHNQTNTIVWKGYTWNIKNGNNLGPGPNFWSRANVWVDAQSYLHLKITKRNGVWYCAELSTTQPLGFGTYQWQVDHQLDTLDPNVVLGLFHYSGPDGYREIDVEYSRWGDPSYYSGGWTVYPERAPGRVREHPFEIAMNGTFSTSRYTWSSKGVNYITMHGFQPIKAVAQKIAAWNYAPTNPKIAIPQVPMSLCMNLWLMNGLAPANNQEVEIVIRNFQKI